MRCNQLLFVCFNLLNTLNLQPLNNSLLKVILPFYFICLLLYIFFTRQPDYADGEFANAVIHYINKTPNAVFIINKRTYSINAAYVLRRLNEDENVTVIYETSNPSAAAVYKWWGYWLQWDEIIASMLIPLLLYYAAKQITGNPTPEALIEELEMKKSIKRRKYD